MQLETISSDIGAAGQGYACASHQQSVDELKRKCVL